MRIALFPIAFATLVAVSAAAQDTPSTRAARYYAEGLERPLLELRTGARLEQSCVDRLKRACDQDQRQLADATHMVDLLDALTLFPQRPAHDTARITRVRDLAARFAANDAALFREAAEYDLLLFARYGAALRACPPEDGAAEYHTSLEALMELNLTGFQALDAAAAAEATSRYKREEEELATRLRAGGHEDCVVARRLGEDLMRLMDSKVQPWGDAKLAAAGQVREFDFNQPAKPKEKVAAKTERDHVLTRTMAGNFLAMVAAELELTAFPESAARMKEIADRDGFPSPQ